MNNRRPDLRQRLINTTNEYIKRNSHPFSFLQGMGKKGMERAKDFKTFLEQRDRDEAELEFEALRRIRKMGSSKKFRLMLDTALCEHLNIDSHLIEKEAMLYHGQSVTVNGAYLFTYDEAKSRVMEKFISSTITLNREYDHELTLMPTASARPTRNRQ